MWDALENGSLKVRRRSDAYDWRSGLKHEAGSSRVDSISPATENEWKNELFAPSRDSLAFARILGADRNTKSLSECTPLLHL